MFLYERFEALRASKGITKVYVAKALNRSPTICQDWKVKKTEPNETQLAIIADILGTTPEYLTGENDDPTPALRGGIPHEKMREVFAEGGVHVLLDANNKMPANHLLDIIDFIKSKQQENDRK